MARQKPRPKDKKLIRKLRNKYRLVLMNDTTFDERFSAFLTPLNVISGIAAVFIVIAVIIVSLIVFTPLKEYIPGYSDSQMRINAANAALMADSLQQKQESYERYFANLQNVLTGNVGNDSVTLQQPESQSYKNLSFKRSEADSLLRTTIEEQEQYALSSSRQVAASMPGVYFFTPIRGLVTSSYNHASGHFGVDVAAPKGHAIKAVLDGTIVFSGFTADGGNVVYIQHANNIVSVYKHLSALLHKTGDHVKAGNTIGIIGNSGEYTDGPHLHFELWFNGRPMDPQEFIAFNP